MPQQQPSARRRLHSKPGQKVEGESVASSERLRNSVHKNRHSLAKMSKEKQITTCAICLGETSVEDKTSLDGCAHLYCYDCIKTWTKDCENSCPQCKAKIKQIKRKDASGKEVVETVLNLQQGMPNFNNFRC